MKVRFWGVRGSIPVPGPETLRVGGNTTCVSVETNDHIIVFDAGTGIRKLGQYLEQGRQSALKGCIFLSHYHWDHIQGLPFFAPAFRPKNRFHLFGEKKGSGDLYAVLSEQMQIPYFPVSMDAQEGLVTFNEIQPGDVVRVQTGLNVLTTELNHPNGAVGFRIETADGTVCIITDHEHPDDGLDPSVIEFARGADVLIHDAPYDPGEKRGPKKGWGHSSWEEAALVARSAQVRRLFLSHHDPDRTDADLDDVLVKARKVFGNTNIAMEQTHFNIKGADF